MKIEKLNENLDYIDIAEKTYDVVNHTYATAIRDHKSNVERITKMMKERSKDAVQGERQPKTIKNAMLKRMHLSESIFDNTHPLGKQKVHEAKERIWTYDAEDGDEWYDMVSFIEDHLSRSDITRPDEQILTRIARISDVNGVSYKNLGIDNNEWLTAKVPLGKYNEDTDEIEISDNEQTQANAKDRADKVVEAAHKIADMYKLGFKVDKAADDKYYEFKIEIPKDSIGQVYCVGDWFEENGLDLDMALTPAYQKRLAKREQLFANPDKNEEFLGKAKNESLTKNELDNNSTYYGLFRTGGSIGEQSGYSNKYGKIVYVFDSEHAEDAKDLAKSRRKSLSRGERSYYGMSYTVKPLSHIDLENEYVKSLIDSKLNGPLAESLTEDLKYGQTKYEELVGKIREYWDAPAIDNLCDLMKDIDEQAAYDLIYKCAEFLEEHADEAIEDSQKYPIEKPKAKDSTFVSAKDKQPKKDLLTENVGFDAILPLVKEWFKFLGDEDCENIAQDFAIGLDKGKDCFEILTKLSKTYDFEVSEFEGICPEIEKLTGLNESVVMNEEAKIISSLEEYVPWAGAVDTWDRISDEGKIEELCNLLEKTYPDGISLGDLNGLLWFEQDWIFGELGIAEDEEEED